jgi:hypothetical protein
MRTLLIGHVFHLTSAMSGVGKYLSVLFLDAAKADPVEDSGSGVSEGT